MSPSSEFLPTQAEAARLRVELDEAQRALGEARRTLVETQDRLRLAHEAGRAGTFDWFIAENRVVWSAELEQLYGVPPGGFEGGLEHWIKRVDAEDSRRILAEIKEVLARNEADYNYEFRALLPDGTERWLRGQARFLYTPEGEPSRMIGINIDIHERHMQEDALIRAEKLAAVGRLAASIAHEINNPLAGVTNLLYLARHSTQVEEIHGFLDVADRELRRVGAISQQTLRFYRQSTDPVWTAARDLFEPVLSILQGRLVNARVELQMRLRSEAPVLCFEGEIRQVLHNLIGNALDALPTGGRLILGSRTGTEWNSGRAGLWFTVADTGTGISPAAQKKIFEAFFTTKGIGGTGLGLWVSQEIVKRHHGTLLVRSSSRERGPTGTVFLLFLPFQALSPAPAQA